MPDQQHDTFAGMTDVSPNTLFDGLVRNRGFELFKKVEDLFVILGRVNPHAPILPIPPFLARMAEVSNQVVSFVLDGTHIGSGTLVGPQHVLTAAHLFFDGNGAPSDSTRLSRMTVEAHTIYNGSILFQGERATSRIAGLTHPVVDQFGVATALDVELDFAIVRLEDALAEDPLGTSTKRGFVNIPSAGAAPVLAPQLPIRVLQFLDRRDLRGSSGFVHDLTMNGRRVRHTASTADSASGAPIVNDHLELVGIHLSGPPSGERPKYNRGLPIRRVAEIIDAVIDGRRIRDQLV